MVAPPAPGSARQRLLEAAVDHALAEGIVDLSLREIAAAVGSSHRMLLYHFGSREGLLVAVVGEVERRERTSVADLSPADALRRWRRLSAPALADQERLFFELYTHALRGRPGTDGFLDDAIEGWLASLTTALVADGVDDATARTVARLGLAVTRGLLLDLLASGDRKGTTAAFELFVDLLDRPA